jgi:hypothetical protein
VTGSSHNGRVLDSEIGFVITNKLERLMQELAKQPHEIERVKSLQKFVEAVMPFPLGLNLWRVQDIYWEMLQKVAPQYQQQAQTEDFAREWLNEFAALGERLGFVMKQLRESNPAVQMAA